jgi:GNAT superfamily N-acetyltransferase
MDPHAIETTSLKAWPAFYEEFYDGWILRFSHGYTKRANSINSFKPSTLPLEEKVLTCEKFYRSQKLPTIFRITPFVSPSNLDKFLEERGYEIIDPTWVLALNLTDLEIQPPLHGEFTSTSLNHWLGMFCGIRGDSLDTHQAHKGILDAIPTPKLFAILQHKNQPLACGVGSLVDSYFGLFDLITDHKHRRKGYGTSLVLGMLSWAWKQGAGFAYLQVVKGNKAAMRLYSKLGFEKAFSYWYRILCSDAKDKL